MKSITKEQLNILFEGIKEEEKYIVNNPHKGIMNSGVPMETRQHLYMLGASAADDKEYYYNILINWDLPFWVRYFSAGYEAAKNWQAAKRAEMTKFRTQLDYETVFKEIVKEINNNG